MADEIPPVFKQFGVADAALIKQEATDAAIAATNQLYTQDAVMTVAMANILAAKEALFTSIDQRGGSGAGELALVGGRIRFPASATGRWSVSLNLDVTLGTTVTVEGRLYDASGAVVGNSRYPRRSALPLATAGPYAMPNLPIVYKPDATQFYTLEIWVGGLLTVGITTLIVGLTKLGLK